MCNLYTTKASAGEVAAFFRAKLPTNFNAGAGEVYPGGQGMVVREDAGELIVQSMAWGFPLAQKSKKTGLPIKPKPVNNIADLSSFMWRFVAPRPENRCIIPLTGFCEAEGEWGSKTRTWFAVKDAPIFAWAGMWKVSDEWGSVYSGLMTDCNEVVRPVHNRMPVLLHEEDYDRWLHGSLEDVIAFQDRCFPDELTAIERTVDPWFRRKSAEQAPAYFPWGSEGSRDAPLRAIERRTFVMVRCRWRAKSPSPASDPTAPRWHDAGMTDAPFASGHEPRHGGGIQQGELRSPFGKIGVGR